MTVHPLYERSAHLVDLVGQAERLAALLPATTDPDALDLAALASVRLDGSRLESIPTSEQLERQPTRVDDLDSVDREPDDEHTSLWVDPLGYVHRSDEHVMAMEFLGVRTSLESDDLAPLLLTDPVPALAELHRRLTRGLVDSSHAGEPRVTEQVVHDASVGRILYYPAAPAQIQGRLAALGAWLVSDGSREHALVSSGVLHHELLAVHPYEAANGRLARTAARLVLRTRGLDPGGRALVEVALGLDPLGYLEEVARTTRRKDLTIWLERWSEAVVAGLREAARAAGVLEVAVSDRGMAFAVGGNPRFTITDFRSAMEMDTETSRSDLVTLLDAGLVTLVPGSRGLRFARTSPAPTTD
jgi:hypothetical protein